MRSGNASTVITTLHFVAGHCLLLAHPRIFIPKSVNLKQPIVFGLYKVFILGQNPNDNNTKTYI